MLGILRRKYRNILVPIYFYGEYNFYHNAMRNALYQSVNGGGRRNEAKSILQFSCTQARTGCRRAEKLPASLQLDIRVKVGGESGLITARQLPYHTRSDATATVRISTSSQH